MKLSYTMSPVDVVCETSVTISKFRVFRFMKPVSLLIRPNTLLGLLSLARKLMFSIHKVVPASRESIQPSVAG